MAFHLTLATPLKPDGKLTYRRSSEVLLIPTPSHSIRRNHPHSRQGRVTLILNLEARQGILQEHRPDPLSSQRPRGRVAMALQSQYTQT
jgi:hypothetical protein